MLSNPEQALASDPITPGLNISRRQAVKVEVARPPLETERASHSSPARIAFQLGGKIVGGGFLNAFAEMQRAQWLTTEELHARRDAYLRNLLKHAAENVPFYSQAY